MPDLITVPTFTYNQGDLFSEENAERPLHVDYYKGTICIRQDGNFTKQEEILISLAHLETFFKEIKKHLPRATQVLEKK